MEHEWNPHERHICHDCGVEEGQLHKLNCDMERCPICGEQAIGCYEHCFYPSGDPRPFMLDDANRIPFILLPTVCMRCGKLWPEMFSVSDEDWEKVVPPEDRGGVLCGSCFWFLAGVLGVPAKMEWPERR